MNQNNTIYVLTSDISDVSIFNIGWFGAISIAISLAIVSAIGLCIRALFIYYIHYDAPKDRPFNTLLWLDQVIMTIHFNKDPTLDFLYFSDISICRWIGLFCLNHMANRNANIIVREVRKRLVPHLLDCQRPPW